MTTRCRLRIFVVVCPCPGSSRDCGVGSADDEELLASRQYESSTGALEKSFANGKGIARRWLPRIVLDEASHGPGALSMPNRRCMDDALELVLCCVGV